MGGQKRQDTERTNEVGYGWMNLGSLLLGLTAWGIPAVYFSRRKPGGDRAGLACLLSMAACAGALFLQVLYNKHLVELQDWSALMDTSGAVAWVSVLLLAVTLTGLSPFDLIIHNYYVYILAIVTIITIQFGLMKTREEKEGIPLYDENMEPVAKKGNL